MENKDYFLNYFGAIKDFMKPADYAQLKEEMTRFTEEHSGLPKEEFRRRTHESFGELLTAIRAKGMIVKLASIEKKVHFFMVITIIGLVAALIGVISIASQIK
jgi:hypothetical protein